MNGRLKDWPNISTFHINKQNPNIGKIEKNINNIPENYLKDMEVWKFERFAQYFHPLGFHEIKGSPLINTLRAFRIS